MAHRPGRIRSIPLLALTLAAACTDPAPAPPATQGAALQVPTPRPWDGTLVPAPTGKATMIFLADRDRPDGLHALFVDANTGDVYDHVRVGSDELGAVVATALLFDPNLAVAGSTVQPVPVGGGKGPRPGTEAYYARELAWRLPVMQLEAMEAVELMAP